MKYKRILLKLSGESLMGDQQYGIDPKTLNYFAQEIAAVSKQGIEIGIVIGGGNIFRGIQGVGQGFDRVQGDYMGMLATSINSMALQTALEGLGVGTQHFSGIAIDPICEKMSRKRAISSIEQGNVVIISGGTGNPFFTTDSGAALRGIEINADVILKGTRVDGIYTADPEKDPTAKKFDEITFDQAYSMNLNIMDLTAFTLCKENNLPILVFDMNTPGNLQKVVSGQKIGTLVKLK
jgi:uridylate kinase